MMTPGTYLKKRRQAARLSVDDVAERIATAPPLAHIDRAAWIERIEEGIDPISADVLATLRSAYPFAPTIVWRLIDLPRFDPQEFDAPRLCMICGCSDRDPCFLPGPEPRLCCGWGSADICTSCTGKDLPHAD